MWRFLLLLPLSLLADVSALYLAWYGDPTTTMTIQWHTPLAEFGDAIWIKKSEGWEEVQGEHATLDQILIHKVALDSLQPNTEYAFRIGNDETIYTFQTAPDRLEEPLRFVVGAEPYKSAKRFRRMCKTVMEHNPHFVVLGGDLCKSEADLYSTRSSHLRRLLAFFADWKKHMISKDRRIIPFLIVPGSCDITPDNYELFFTFFAFPKKQLYRAIDFGSYLTLILLDTGHFQPIEGQQTNWLEKTLSSRQESTYRFAVYEGAAYPSSSTYKEVIPQKIRKHWVPLFEKYGLLAAFENHNQAFKRTYPIKAHQIDPTGVVYLSDGSWGAPPRKTDDQWYLFKRNKKNSIFLIELTTGDAHIQSIDLLNNQLDELSFCTYK